jgi:hypothetical protein
MKKYLISVRSWRGMIAHIGYYTDTPCKNYRIYYNGSDTGERFEYLGNAARHLEKLAAAWERGGARLLVKDYGTAAKVPRRGSNP